MEKVNVNKISAYLSPEEYEAIRRMAFEAHVKMNDVIRQAIQNISGQAVILNKAAGAS